MFLDRNKFNMMKFKQNQINNLRSKVFGNFQK